MKIGFFVVALWIGVPIAVGFALKHFFGGSFWLGFGLAVFALIVNAVVIEWEDRQPGGWIGPDDEK